MKKISCPFLKKLPPMPSRQPLLILKVRKKYRHAVRDTPSAPTPKSTAPSKISGEDPGWVYKTVSDKISSVNPLW